ncbi:MAG: sigma-70 family RNA polymerase sigma factor [Planctomycetota bacterium]
MDQPDILSTNCETAGEEVTRASLIFRLRDNGDQEAWFDFERIYRPTLTAMARSQGFQAADADDLVQTVFLSIAGAIEQFDPDSHRAKFRTWLKTIARNAIINALTRPDRIRAAGGSAAYEILDRVPDKDCRTQNIEWEYRRQIFEQAAGEIRRQTAPELWQCFWETAVKGRSGTEVALELNRSLTSVYAARSRILKRLRHQVSILDTHTHAPEGRIV